MCCTFGISVDEDWLRMTMYKMRNFSHQTFAGWLVLLIWPLCAEYHITGWRHHFKSTVESISLASRHWNVITNTDVESFFLNFHYVAISEEMITAGGGTFQWIQRLLQVLPASVLWWMCKLPVRLYESIFLLLDYWVLFVVCGVFLSSTRVQQFEINQNNARNAN